jgi:hypothetical protein
MRNTATETDSKPAAASNPRTAARKMVAARATAIAAKSAAKPAAAKSAKLTITSDMPAVVAEDIRAAKRATASKPAAKPAASKPTATASKPAAKSSGLKIAAQRRTVKPAAKSAAKRTPKPASVARKPVEVCVRTKRATGEFYLSAVDRKFARTGELHATRKDALAEIKRRAWTLVPTPAEEDFVSSQKRYDRPSKPAASAKRIPSKPAVAKPAAKRATKPAGSDGRVPASVGKLRGATAKPAASAKPAAKPRTKRAA